MKVVAIPSVSRDRSGRPLHKHPNCPHPLITSKIWLAKKIVEVGVCQKPPWSPDPGEVGASMEHTCPPDPGGARGYNHNAATTKTDGKSEAEGVKAVAKNKESTATPTKLNSLISNDFARALAPDPALKTAGPFISRALRAQVVA